jgi:hypothetical protein
VREIRRRRVRWRGLETAGRDRLRHRQMAKATGTLQLPGPMATAPVLDPTSRGTLRFLHR